MVASGPPYSPVLIKISADKRPLNQLTVKNLFFYYITMAGLWGVIQFCRPAGALLQVGAQAGPCLVAAGRGCVPAASLCTSGSALAACCCRDRWCCVHGSWIHESGPSAALAEGRSRPLLWLPARWAFGFYGDHQQNLQCVLIYRCCVLIHVWCSLFSVGNKVYCYCYCSIPVCMVQCTHLITTGGTPNLYNRGSSMQVNSLHSGANNM